ncbi:MAG: NAD(P)H-hydrate epimerase [Phycisphaerales bacterium]|nr:NAD(P)H-hydrate epimerase [Phycisphaerales bacterium]
MFDRDAVRAVDRAAIQEYGIPGAVLMENAAVGLAEHAMLMLPPAVNASPAVLIVCGAGNNGGDGYALARHLHNRRVEVILCPLGEPKIDSDAGINRTICRNMNLREMGIDRLGSLNSEGIALIVDAIFGTGLDRQVSGEPAQVIEWINAARRPVLAADVPSGMDCNTGEALGHCVRASRTVTFVGMKTGFFGLEAQKLLGEVFVADIGAPIELLTRFGKPMKELWRRDAPEHEPTDARTATPGKPGR